MVFFLSTANFANLANRESASRIPWLRRGSMRLSLTSGRQGLAPARPIRLIRQISGLFSASGRKSFASLAAAQIAAVTHQFTLGGDKGGIHQIIPFLELAQAQAA